MALTRSIADASQQINLVAHRSRARRLAHNMGGLAASAYAGRNEVAVLALITPLVPLAHGTKADRAGTRRPARPRFGRASRRRSTTD